MIAPLSLGRVHVFIGDYEGSQGWEKTSLPLTSSGRRSVCLVEWFSGMSPTWAQLSEVSAPSPIPSVSTNMYVGEYPSSASVGSLLLTT
jgi:hypothetical protein